MYPAKPTFEKNTNGSKLGKIVLDAAKANEQIRMSAAAKA